MPECKHGFSDPAFCATCRGILSPEEEVAQEESEFDSMLDRWSNVSSP